MDAFQIARQSHIICLYLVGLAECYFDVWPQNRSRVELTKEVLETTFACYEPQSEQEIKSTSGDSTEDDPEANKENTARLFFMQAGSGN